MNQTEKFKRMAARSAIEAIEPGMVVGLGEGSTTLLAARELGQRLKNGQLQDIVCIVASQRMEQEAQRLGIPLTSFEENPVIDLTLDGADEVDAQLNLIKGGGGALLREKILAQASRREIIIVDESKLSALLGTHWALPVEVIPFGSRSQLDFLNSLGARVTLRKTAEAQPFQTDQGNLIFDCDFGPIAAPEQLAAQLDRRAGIVEHGLFLGLVSEVVVAGVEGVRHLNAGSV